MVSSTFYELSLYKINRFHVALHLFGKLWIKEDVKMWQENLSVTLA